MKTKYKYIHFNPFADSVWEIRNNKSNGILGYIERYPKWKGYVFSASGTNIIFGTGCLSDIIDFMNQLPKP